MRVMQIYCNQLGVLVTNDDEINSCLNIAIGGKEKFKEIADKEKRSASNLANKLINDYVKEHSK